MPMKDTKARTSLFLAGEKLSHFSIFLRRGVSSSEAMEKSREGRQEDWA
jgi:hypothetical protein